MMKKIVAFTIAICIMTALLSGCSEHNSQNDPSFAIVTLGADSVYVGNHHIMIPADIDVGLIADIDIMYMGTLYDVLNLGMWACQAEIQQHILFPIDNISTFLVFGFLTDSNEFLGHSVTHSPVYNAHTLECYEMRLVEIICTNVKGRDTI